MNTITAFRPVEELGADPLPAPLRYRVRWTFADDLVVDVVTPRRFGLPPRSLGFAYVGPPIELPGVRTRSATHHAEAVDRAVLDACRRAWAFVQLNAKGLHALDDRRRYTV